MPFAYHRTVRFADTDAAGVVYFANYLAICHEAYEESLGAAGINLKTFFSDHGVIIPIARSEADYLRPLSCGDRLRITFKPELLQADSFALNFELTRLGPPEKCAARIRTVHVCTSTTKKGRAPLPPAIAAWVAAG
ncbi:MAG: acyl-CoA thioesterase [Verrucomicrobia bacterium]|nr:acyl-CoA thioesterase [Verrucomicrobiota bacterium]